MMERFREFVCGFASVSPVDGRIMITLPDRLTSRVLASCPDGAARRFAESADVPPDAVIEWGREGSDVYVIVRDCGGGRPDGPMHLVQLRGRVAARFQEAAPDASSDAAKPAENVVALPEVT